MSGRGRGSGYRGRGSSNARTPRPSRRPVTRTTQSAATPTSSTNKSIVGGGNQPQAPLQRSHATSSRTPTLVRIDSDDDEKDGASEPEGLVLFSTANNHVAAANSSSIPHRQDNFFSRILAPLPGATVDDTELSPPFTMGQAQKISQRIWTVLKQGGIGSKRNEYNDSALLYALDSTCGRQVIEGLLIAYSEQNRAGELISELIMPLLRDFFEENTFERLAVGATRHPFRRFLHLIAGNIIAVKGLLQFVGSEEASISDCFSITKIVCQVLSESSRDLDSTFLSVLFMLIEGLRTIARSSASSEPIHHAIARLSQLVKSICPCVNGGEWKLQHDNDFHNFRQIALLPTRAELLCEVPPQQLLREDVLIEIEDGEVVDINAANQWNALGWIDRSFRLLREDLIGPLREEIAMLRTYYQKQELSGRSSTTIKGASSNRTKAAISHEIQTKRLMRKTFHGVAFQSINPGWKYTPPHFRVRFTQPSELQTVNHGVKPESARVKFWDANFGLLAKGSLVCFVRLNGEPVRFGIVVSRHVDELANVNLKSPGEEESQHDASDDADPTGGYVGVQICGGDETLQTMSELRSKGFDEQSSLMLVQVSAAFFAYEPILRRLQTLTSIPFPEILLKQPRESDVGVRSSLLNSALESALKQLHSLATSGQDVRSVLGVDITTATGIGSRPIILDLSQMEAIRQCIVYRVPCIQGPPGTGKSLVGSIVARLLLLHTQVRICVIGFSNHAVDDFLLKLIQLGFSTSEIVRIGGSKKISNQIEPFLLHNLTRTQLSTFDSSEKVRYGQCKRSSEWLFAELDKAQERLHALDPTGPVKWATITQVWEALSLSVSDLSRSFHLEGATTDQDMKVVGPNGKVLTTAKVWKLWRTGQSKPNSVPESELWQLDKMGRESQCRKWMEQFHQRELARTSDLLCALEEVQADLADLQTKSERTVLRNRRVVGATTNGSAKYRSLLDALPGPHVLLVEEAAEILEAHLLAGLTDRTAALIQIGDHKQLRPRVAQRELEQQSGKGYDLNVSLMERMIHSKFPLVSLEVQHRMHPDIASIVRSLGTYSVLRDAPPTYTHSMIRGLTSRVIFLDHSVAESNRGASSSTGVSKINSESLSRVNDHEATMVTYIVKYLLDQGYAPKDIAVLTPYSGQLMLLKEKLHTAHLGVELNAKDAKTLTGAGEDLNSPLTVSATLQRRTPLKSSATSVHLATIDNAQGEEYSIVIVSLVRSNHLGKIGFIGEHERVNVMLSRARDGLILIGDADTLSHSLDQPILPSTQRRLWAEIVFQFDERKTLFSGLPTRCERHGMEQIIRHPSDFSKVANGGCSIPCGEPLPCLHPCALKCHSVHQSHGACTKASLVKCTKGHESLQPCTLVPTGHIPTCLTCIELVEIETAANVRALEVAASAAARRQKDEVERKALQLEIDSVQTDLTLMDQERDRAVATEQTRMDKLKLDRLRDLKERGHLDEIKREVEQIRNQAAAEMAAEELEKRSRQSRLTITSLSSSSSIAIGPSSAAQKNLIPLTVDAPLSSSSPSTVTVDDAGQLAAELRLSNHLYLSSEPVISKWFGRAQQQSILRSIVDNNIPASGSTTIPVQLCPSDLSSSIFRSLEKGSLLDSIQLCTKLPSHDAKWIELCCRFQLDDESALTESRQVNSKDTLLELYTKAKLTQQNLRWSESNYDLDAVAYATAYLVGFSSYWQRLAIVPNPPVWSTTLLKMEKEMQELLEMAGKLVQSSLQAHSAPRSQEKSPEERWVNLKAIHHLHSPAMDTIMNLVGLRPVKEELLQLVELVGMEKLKGRDPTKLRLHVRAEGNAGTD